MDWLVDEIILLAFCLPLVTAQPFGACSVVSVLAVVVVACIAQLVPSKMARISVLSAYLVAALFLAPFTSMLPVVAYQCVRQPYPAFRVAWLISIVGSGIMVGAFPAFPAFLLCLLATVLAVRAARNAAEKRVLRLARDGVQEKLLDARLIREAFSPDATEVANAGEVPHQENTTLFVDRPCEAGAGLLDGLTDREQAIAGLIARGLDNKEIAAELYLGEGTVRNHISAILQKCHLKNRTQVAIMYLQEMR